VNISSLNTIAENFIFSVVEKYETIQFRYLPHIEFVVSGAFIEKIFRAFLTLVVAVIPPSLADRFDPLLAKLSRRDMSYKNGEEPGWIPYILLTEKTKIKERDMRILIMRNLLTDDGEIDIILGLERQRALSALLVIGIVVLVFVFYFVYGLHAISYEVSFLLVIAQLGIIVFLSAMLLIVVLVSSYIVFFLGLVPFSTVHRLIDMKKELMFAGIPVRIR